MVSDEALKKLQEQIAAWPMTQRFVVQQLIEDYSNIRKDLLAYVNTGLEPAMCANYKSFEDVEISKGVTFKRIVALMEADRGRAAGGAAVQGGRYVIQSVRRRNLRAQSQEHEIPCNTGTVGH
nr:MAG TPA: hypothetical protein [Caudoviricetes sp.]